jgi:NAD(P)-dependent dehydrogenase (short-subunit alcohol dehydrogenase family)
VLSCRPTRIRARAIAIALGPAVDWREVVEDLGRLVLHVGDDGRQVEVGQRDGAGGEERGGSIINISSIGAIAPSPNELRYSAAKVGLNTLADGMARAFGPVRISTIMGRSLLTDISTAWWLLHKGVSDGRRDAPRGGRVSDRGSWSLPGAL